jgi:aerobic carbon-monoxide dehydrogenase medium subunit
MAGSQSLGPMLNLRVLQPSLLVDLRFLSELKNSSEDRDSVTLGACVTHAQIEDGRVPDPTGGFMREVASNIAYRAVRNRGTVGGSLVHADPAADWPSALTLLGATALIAGPGGRREIPMEKFLTGLFETALSAQEILVAVRIPKRSKAARFGYWKFCRKAGEFPQAIGGALRDPERKETRAVIGATSGAPRLFLDLNPDTTGIGKDAYSRQLHAVALKRAVEKVLA